MTSENTTQTTEQEARTNAPDGGRLPEDVDSGFDVTAGFDDPSDDGPDNLSEADRLPETDTEAHATAQETDKGAETDNGINPVPPENPEEKPETAETEGEPDYKALYLQIRDTENAEKYRARVHELTEQEGLPLSVATLAATQEFGKSYPLKDGGTAKPPDGGQPRDFMKDLQALKAAYPDMKVMPEEVINAYNGGQNLLSAYGQYRAKADAAEIVRLRDEIAQYKQQSPARAAAPVRGVSNSAVQQSDDRFAGWDDDNGY